MSARPEKILALQFKYFGDAVLMTPALRALREHNPKAELHLLVPEEIAPLFQHLTWLHRIWPMPRRRGQANFGRSWPVIRSLRRERFDRSVDFAGNDRGALLSFLIGAPNRLGWNATGGFFGRRFCYTQRVNAENTPVHETRRLTQLLSGWQIPAPHSLEAEIRADATLADRASTILPIKNVILCHVASSQPKKEWPLAHWAELCRLADVAGHQLIFTTARGEREATLMTGLKQLLPDAKILPPVPDLPLFLAVLARAGMFISGDTGPLHFAAGLGVPTISLFGPTAPARWAPIGARHAALTGGQCGCDGNRFACGQPKHCLATITPERVWAELQRRLASSDLSGKG